MSEERKGVVSLNSVCLTNILNLSFQEKGLTNWFQNQLHAGYFLEEVYIIILHLKACQNLEGTTRMEYTLNPRT